MCIANNIIKHVVQRDSDTESLYISWQWRHNGRDGVSNHQPHDCLLNRLFRRRSRKTSNSAPLAFVREIHLWLVNSPHKWTITRKMFPFDDFILLWCRHALSLWLRGRSLCEQLSMLSCILYIARSYSPSLLRVLCITIYHRRRLYFL